MIFANFLHLIIEILKILSPRNSKTKILNGHQLFWDCTFGKWFIEDNAPEKSEFANSAALVSAYQDGRTEIIKSNERLKLGKPVCMNHVKKLLENQIQLSNLTQVRI